MISISLIVGGEGELLLIRRMLDGGAKVALRLRRLYDLVQADRIILLFFEAVCEHSW